MTNSLATLAVAEFHRRKASIDEAVAAHRFPRAQGEANLRLWLAIALTAGARPRDCGALFEHWQEECEYSDAIARVILLEDGPSREEWHAELARARDAASSKARARPTDRSAQERSLTLQCLAIALGVSAEAHAMKEAA